MGANKASTNPPGRRDAWIAGQRLRTQHCDRDQINEIEADQQQAGTDRAGE